MFAIVVGGVVMIVRVLVPWKEVGGKGREGKGGRWREEVDVNKRIKV